MATGAISLDGERFPLGGLGRIRATHVDEHPDRLSFRFPGRGITVTGTVLAPRERFVGWIYADPDGAEHHTLNCSIADLALTVARTGRPARTLTATGVAAYEFGLREHNHGMAIQPFGDG